MSDTYQQALRQAAKLLKLAEHANTSPEEAAVAASKAQEIMTRFKIEHIVAQESQVTPEPEEEIEDFAKKGAHLYNDGGQKVSGWLNRLAVVLSKANQCKVYTSWTPPKLGRRASATIEIIGRPSDAETVRYMFGYLSNEVERLTKIHGKGCGRTWCNNFRLGIVDAVSERLKAQRKTTEEELRKQAEAGSTMALVKVDNALAVLDRRLQEAEDFAEETLNLRKTYSRATFDPSAREAGRNAGKNISLGGAKGGLGSGRKALKG